MEKVLFPILNFGIFFWFCFGVPMKRNRQLHAFWMTLGFALDTTLLLFIELDRSAIKQMGGVMNFWLQIHIGIATLLIFLYPALLFSGGKVSMGAPVTWHKRMAMSFLVLRLLLAVTAVLAMAAKA